MDYYEICEDALIEAITKMYPFSVIRFSANGKISRFNYERQEWVTY